MGTTRTEEPLVAVVTPVYNGERYLENCLESVRTQEYTNWVHVIVDNVSTDRTREIAESFAAKDPRFKVCVQDEHVGMIQNWNRALGLAPRATYVKQLHADDALGSACLRRMVEALETHPEATIASSRFHAGPNLRPVGAPEATVLLEGEEVGRVTMRGFPNLLASPSIPMVRVDASRSFPELFNADSFPPGHPDSPPLCQADKEGYLSFLEQGKVVFLEEPLQFLRTGDASAEGWSRSVGAYRPGRVEFLLRHGDRFFDKKAQRAAVRVAARKYLESIVVRAILRRQLFDGKFVQYHLLCLEHLATRVREGGHRLTALGMSLAALVLRVFGSKSK